MDGFLVAAVDFGSEKLSVSLGREENGQFNIIDTSCGISRGIKKGIIRDKVKCTEDLKKVINDLEMVTKNDIVDIYAGISARDLRYVDVRSLIKINYNEITAKDIIEAMEKGKEKIALSDEEDIVDIHINYYILDGEIIYENPIGRIGNNLELSLTVIIGLSDELNLYKEVILDAGYRFNGFLVNIIAGKQVFVQGKSASGVKALVDIGAGTSDLAIYEDGILKYIYSIPIGGNNITRDLSICGEISLSEAERIKRIHSNNYVTLYKDVMIDDEINIDSVTLSKTLLYEVTRARIEEILKYVNLELKNSSFFDGICSIIIYGDGISYFEDIQEIVKHTIEKRTNIITKDKLGIENSENITSLALVKEVYDRIKLINDDSLNYKEEIDLEEEIENYELEKEQRGIIKRLKSFLEDIF